MFDKLWIAQFNTDNGGNESIVLFRDKPTQKELQDFCGPDQKLESVYELERCGGPMLSGLPTDRALVPE